MRKQNWLGVLKVGATRHCDAEVLFCSSENDLDQVDHLTVQNLRLVEQVDANQCGDLVVARPTGTHLASELWAGNLD